MQLNTIILSYLKSFKKKIIFSDHSNSYNGHEFLEKILNYKKKLNLLWKNSKNKGVVIILDRDVDYIALIFASWLAGGYYVPLSTESNNSNIKKYTKISKASLLVKKINNKITFQKLNAKQSNNLIQKKLAYIIFTSGSTGDKKGVCISRNNLIQYYSSIKKKFKGKYKPKSLIINGELTFDITLADIIFAIIFKSEIVLTNSSKNLISLINLIYKRKVESVYLVPTTIRRLISVIDKIGFKYVKSIKQINSGGETLNISTVNKIRKIFGRINFYNFYGPTEFTINSTIYKIDLNYKKSEIPIGKILPGIKYFIKKNNNLSKSGELYLAGKQKMLGYINSKNPFIKVNKIDYYPTGDLVKINQFKELIFLGRNKDYIKHNGYRINFATISDVISSKIDVNLFLKKKKNKIILYIETSKKTGNTRVKIQKIINDNLEFYERPDRIKIINKFPTLESGKIDIKKIK